jgi:hypothetical protein
MKFRLPITFVIIAALLAFRPVVAQGYKAYLNEDGEPVVRFPEVYIYAYKGQKGSAKDFRRQEKKFNRLRYNVIKVLPYANECAKNLKILRAEMKNIKDQKTRDLYLKSREHFLFGRYEGELKDLTIYQGKLLVKLIDRQTGNTTYSLIHDMKSPAAAFFWQSMGKLIGYNLKQEYDPEEELAIEVIVTAIERGENPTFYDYIEASARK